MRKLNMLGFVVLGLLICVMASSIVWANCFNQYMIDDSKAIFLISTEANKQVKSKPNGQTQSINSSSFEVKDDEKIWSTNTEVNIFRASYRNEKNEITVLSDDKDALIAPGTDYQYTFLLKNNGDNNITYTLELEAYESLSDIHIPIEARLIRYDGKAIVGNENQYENGLALNGAKDEATLSAGRYAYYKLDWKWVFENNQDELDTLLGNKAVDEDLRFTIALKTIAVENKNDTGNHGLIGPQTGDNSNSGLWVMMMLGAFSLIILLLTFSRKEEE